MSIHKITTEEYITKATMVWGSRWDYSHAVYNGANRKIAIRCPIHDVICYQNANSHLRGLNPCPMCVGSHRKALTQDEFIDRATKNWGNRFDYTDTRYHRMKEKVSVRCRKHDTVCSVYPESFINGLNPCPQCNHQSSITKDEFIARSRGVHGDSFDYSLVNSEDIRNMHSKVKLICRKHDEIFRQEINVNLRGANGCPKCNHTAHITKDILAWKASRIWPDKHYDYSKIDYSKGVKEKQLIGCPLNGHGWFRQTLDNHLTGREGCPICDHKRRMVSVDEFIARSKSIFGDDRYDYSKLVLPDGLKNAVIALTCRKHGDFRQLAFAHLQGYEGCGKCRSYGTSRGEQELCAFIESLGFHVVQNDRTVISPKELDCYVPDKHLAFEYNGLYWHSEDRGKDSRYHHDKVNACAAQGIRLVMVWEDDWRDRNAIMKEHIREVLHVSNLPRVSARQCVASEIPSSTARSFLESYHIQGFSAASSYLGLYAPDHSLCAVMSFMRMHDNDAYTLSRYATSCIVRGGHSKLLKEFIMKHHPSRLVTFADISFSDGGLYESTGWENDGDIKPDYSYVDMGDECPVRYHKFNYRLKRFRNDDLLYYRDGLSERQLADANGLLRVWDCGKTRYVMDAKMIENIMNGRRT